MSRRFALIVSLFQVYCRKFVNVDRTLNEKVAERKNGYNNQLDRWFAERRDEVLAKFEDWLHGVSS